MLTHLRKLKLKGMSLVEHLNILIVDCIYIFKLFIKNNISILYTLYNNNIKYKSKKYIYIILL
jgi:hypothetical protein